MTQTIDTSATTVTEMEQNLDPDQIDVVEPSLWERLTTTAKQHNKAVEELDKLKLRVNELEESIGIFASYYNVVSSHIAQTYNLTDQDTINDSGVIVRGGKLNETAPEGI